jgi:hypothetical protein
VITLNRNFTWLAVTSAPLPVSPVVALSARDSGGAQTVVGVEFLGEVVVPTGTVFDGTEIGGLSSITFDAGRGLYYTLSDD